MKESYLEIVELVEQCPDLLTRPVRNDVMDGLCRDFHLTPD